MALPIFIGGMKVKKCLLWLIISSSLLGGCNILDKQQDMKLEEIRTHNKLVDDTVNNFAVVKNFAEGNKEGLMRFILQDELWNWGHKAELEPLTDEEKESFKIKGVVYDEFFTSLGASGVREILVINGTNHRMYVTVIWGEEDIISLERVVKEL